MDLRVSMNMRAIILLETGPQGTVGAFRNVLSNSHRQGDELDSRVSTWSPWDSSVVATTSTRKSCFRDTRCSIG